MTLTGFQIMMRSDRKAPDRGRSNEGLLALFPLALVACAIAFLAFGAGRVGSDPGVKPSGAVAQANVDSAAVEEAAAAAVVAISLARVAPALPEEALEPRKPAATPAQASAAAGQQDARKPAPRREAGAQVGAQAGKPRETSAGQSRGEPAQAPQDVAASQTKPEAKPAQDNPGVLARIGAYAPSPSRIAGAVSEGVSKIASYIPGL